jgi:Ca-activated chloride channel family protein
MSSQPDYYRLMGLPRDATFEEIRNAYFDAARRFHPDANPDPQAKEQFIALQAAYEVLSNSDKRKAYDSLVRKTEYKPAASINVQYSRSSVPRLDEQQLVYVLVEIIPTAELDEAKRPPLHLALVIDRSTSMKGERMDMVKANVIQLIRKLSARDILSVVAFSDRSEVVVPAAKVQDVEKMIDQITMLECTGGTEIYQGLYAAINQLRLHDGKNASRHVILLTDGQTYGDEEKCLELTRKAAHESIVVSALGIGHEWNDAFLDHLASLSGGNTLFVSTRRDLYRFMEQKVNAMGSIYATGLSLEFNTYPGAQLRYAIRLSPEVSPLPVSSPLMLGNLNYGRRQIVLFEFLLSEINQSAATARLANGFIRLEVPSDRRTAELPLSFSRPITTDIGPELPPSEIVDAMARLTLYRLQERARSEVEAGDIAQATKHLQYLASHLLSQGDRELAHTVLVEAEHISQSHRFSKDGDKQIKYGTRALLLPISLESYL